MTDPARGSALRTLTLAAGAALALSSVGYSLIAGFAAGDGVQNDRQRIVAALALIACVVTAVVALVALVAPVALMSARWAPMTTYAAGGVGLVAGVLGSRSGDLVAEEVGVIVMVSAIAVICVQFLRGGRRVV